MPIHEQPIAVRESHLAAARRLPMQVQVEGQAWVARTSDPRFPFVIGASGSPEAAIKELVVNLAGQLAAAEQCSAPAESPVTS